MAFQWPGDSYATIAPPDDLPDSRPGSKKQLVLNAITAQPSLSNSEIAASTGASERYVRELRNNLETVS
jgi:hypothetical protein